MSVEVVGRIDTRKDWFGQPRGLTIALWFLAGFFGNLFAGALLLLFNTATTRADARWRGDS